MISRQSTPAAFLIASLWLTACAEREPAATPPAATATPSWLLTAPPEGALTVTDAKANAAEGERLVLHARIGGRPEPISAASPVFTVVDLALPYCGQETNDGCPTPWDYCCETPETIADHAATVQIVDADGHPITESLTARGLAPLDEIFIVGATGPRPNNSVLTIRATGLYRVTN